MTSSVNTEMELYITELRRDSWRARPSFRGSYVTSYCYDQKWWKLTGAKQRTGNFTLDSKLKEKDVALIVMSRSWDKKINPFKYLALQEEPMAKLVTTTCKPKTVLNHRSTRTRGLVFIVAFEQWLVDFNLRSKDDDSLQSYNADAEGNV